MIEPQGPLPPEVYWRRRAVAGVGVLAVVVLVVVLIVWSVGGADPAPENAAAAGTEETTETPQPSESGDEGVDDEGVDATGEPAPPGNGGTGGGDGGAPNPAADQGENPSEAPASGPDGVPLCEDRNLSLVLETDKPTYAVGDTPIFTLVITNGGRTACARDVGQSAQNVIVKSLDGARTIWTVRDCSPGNEIKNVTLEPGAQTTESITWSGTTSSPGCERPRERVVAGSYQAIGKIGEKESAPITFNMVAPATD